MMINHNSFKYRVLNSIQKTLVIYFSLILVSNFAIASDLEEPTDPSEPASVGADPVTPPPSPDEPSAVAASDGNPMAGVYAGVTDASAIRTAREAMLRSATGDPRMSYVPVRPSFSGDRAPAHSTMGERFISISSVRQAIGLITGTDQTTSCTPERARSVLAQLTYMGNNFPVQTTANCIQAYTDAEAANRGGGRYINPANPDYGNALTGGSQAYNPAGFYIQIANVNANSKEQLCANPNFRSLSGLDFRGVSDQDIKNYLSPRSQVYRNTYAGGGPDTVCTCLTRSMQNPNGTPMDCTGNQFRVRVEEAINNLSASSARLAQIDGARDQRIQAAAGAAGASDGTTVTPQNSPNTNVVAQCIQDYWTRSENCRRLSEAARSACRLADESNAPTDAIGQVLGGAAGMNTAMRAGTGAQGNCMRASVLAMGAREAMRGMGQSCSAEVNSCKDSCKSDSYDTFLRQCIRNNNTSVALLESAPESDPAGRAFKQRNEGIRSNYENGVRVCNRDLRGAQSDVSNLMTGMGNSLQASMMCACQTSNAAGADCNAIPNMNTCDTDPSMAGCQVYGQIGACVPGAVGYDAKTCNCLQNPAATGCGAGGGTTPASLFGGNLRGGPAAGGSFAGGGMPAAATGGGRASNLDLSSGSESIQANLSEASGTGMATAKPSGAYGGSVGGGGGGNGAASDEGVLAGAPPEGGLGGLFNQAKNAVMNALGKGSNRSSRTAGRNANVDPNNMKKFKPLRGLANSEGMGTKNMDIWKMVNMCANGETCASNRNNYMMAP